jgi:hypothetical protein
MQKLFTIMVDEQVVLRQGGVYRQVPLYTYGNQIFAKFGSGFVGLHKPDHTNGTTKPDVTWEKDSLSFEPLFDNNRMVLGVTHAAN